MTVVDAHGLRTVLDDAMEIVAMTDDRARELVAPVLRHLLDMAALGVDVAPLLAALKKCCDYNDLLHEKARAICAQLDDMARAAHHSAGRRADEPSPLTVRAILGALREPLAVLADPQAYDAAAYVTASTAVKSVIAQVPAHKLLSDSVRRNLGGSRHDLLASLVRADTALELAA